MMTITNATIAANSATIGGGILNDGTMTITNATIAANSATIGGGILNDGTMTAVNSTIADNQVGRFGSGGGLDAYAGTASLFNTIVALNTRGSGSTVKSDDISLYGGGTIDPSSANNLIGTGGSGGLSNGNNGNIVLTTLTGIGLAPLGSYGGLTQTIALLPGSPAIDAGSTTFPGVTVPTTDQRGEGRVGATDIGTFESQGFTLTTVASSTPQSTLVGTAFADPLAVTVAANNPVEPVAGGTVTFSAPTSGASAILSATTATIDTNGQAGVTATANGTTGSYTVTASASGAATPASFSLTNQTTIATVAVTWGSQTTTLQTAADGLRMLPAGRNTDMPWFGIQNLPITFNQAVSLAPTDVTVTGLIGVNYGPVTVSGSGTSYTITLAQPINNADRVTITIAKATIVGFTRRLDILPGDVNDNGAVNTTDGLLILHNQTPAHAYQTIYDMNGDGAVTMTDFNLYRPKIGTVLPPLPPPASADSLGALVDIALGAIDDEDFAGP